jgi:hypothetical protein
MVGDQKCTLDECQGLPIMILTHVVDIAAQINMLWLPNRMKTAVDFNAHCHEHYSTSHSARACTISNIVLSQEVNQE